MVETLVLLPPKHDEYPRWRDDPAHSSGSRISVPRRTPRIILGRGPEPWRTAPQSRNIPRPSEPRCGARRGHAGAPEARQRALRAARAGAPPPPHRTVRADEPAAVAARRAPPADRHAPSDLRPYDPRVGHGQ